MIVIPVDLGTRRYSIHVGLGAIRSLRSIVSSSARRRVVVVSSPRIWSLHGGRFEKALGGTRPFERVLMADGERRKTRATLDRIHDAFVDCGLGRDGVVVALGGGVVGDVAGFAAATYMRGVDLVQVPTTLLAMVDSSIGGKVGINHPKAKNMIGAFHQPRAVVVDPSFLDTLPPRERRSGAYEILKCGILGDRSLFAAMADAPEGLVGWDRAALERAIAAACRIKAGIVEKDEREGGLRRVLNLGHTLGHALETVTSYRRFTHGEAVGWGLIGAAWIATRKRLLKESAFLRIAASVDRLGPRPPLGDLPATAILAAVGRDKKVRDGRVPFVLPTRVGRVVICDDVSSSDVRDALRSLAGRSAARL
jgi:3-dehydroquinate synthase